MKTTSKTETEKKEKKVKDPATKQSKPLDPKSYRSIREACYALFDRDGVDNVKVEDAMKLAQAIKPDTKFNKWHLYYHRKGYKDMKRAKEAQKLAANA